MWRPKSQKLRLLGIWINPLLLTNDEPCLRLYYALRKEVNKTITMQYLKTNHLETEDRSTSFPNTESYGGPLPALTTFMINV